MTYVVKRKRALFYRIQKYNFFINKKQNGGNYLERFLRNRIFLWIFQKYFQLVRKGCFS